MNEQKIEQFIEEVDRKILRLRTRMMKENTKLISMDAEIRKLRERVEVFITEMRTKNIMIRRGEK